jgi:hypothetical protein
MSLLPTGTCFTDSMEFIESILDQVSNAGLAEYSIVHALCLRPSGGIFAHAWVEHRDLAIFAALDGGERRFFSFPSDHYRRNVRAVEIQKYSIAQACAENLRHKSYGPWVAKYRERCSDFIGPPRPYSFVAASELLPPQARARDSRLPLDA